MQLHPLIYMRCMSTGNQLNSMTLALLDLYRFLTSVAANDLSIESNNVSFNVRRWETMDIFERNV